MGSAEELTEPKNVPPTGRNVQDVTSYITSPEYAEVRMQHTTSGQPTDAPVLKSQAIRTKKVFTLEDSESLSTDNESNLLIDPIRIDGLTKPSAWLSTLSTWQGNITLKLDTGAEANILPISTYNKIPFKPPCILLIQNSQHMVKPLFLPSVYAALTAILKSHNTMWNFLY